MSSCPEVEGVTTQLGELRDASPGCRHRGKLQGMYHHVNQLWSSQIWASLLRKAVFNKASKKFLQSSAMEVVCFCR